MNSLERTMAAIHGGLPDKVPVDLHNFQMCAEASGLEFQKFFTDGNVMAEYQIALWKRFGHDVMLLENGTAALAEALGCHVTYRKDAPPVIHQPLLQDIRDVHKLKSIDIKTCPILRENLKATKKVVRELGDKVFIMGRGDQGPFSLAALLLGIDAFMIELATGEHDQLIHKLLGFCTDFIMQYTTEQIKTGAHGTSIGDSTAGPDLVSPTIYRTYAVQYEKYIAEAVHDVGGLFALHICGNATHIIEDMIRTQADILEIDQKTDLGAARDYAKGKATLLGQIEPLKFRVGAPADIAEEVHRELSLMGVNGGFVLGPGCALASDTPYSNIEALIQARDNFC